MNFVWRTVGSVIVTYALIHDIGWWAVLAVLGIAMMIDGSKRGSA